jgi:hypothetical protein
MFLGMPVEIALVVKNPAANQALHAQLDRTLEHGELNTANMRRKS